VGCPAPSVLKAIAQHRIPLSQADQWLKHLGSCSPCFQDFRNYRAEVPTGKGRVLQMALAAAAVILIVIGGLLWVRSRSSIQSATATIDLRDHSITRGESPADSNQAPLELSKKVRHLILDLPVGSKEGTYELALLSSGSEEVQRTMGMAQLQDHAVILKTDIDLTGVSPGLYVLGLRQSGLEWYRYPVHVK
jgi:hypothetical protein